ncbi:lysine:proton symporter (APA family) [Tumebacillus sp. BK434]|uniref:amino acid permease n=1 Tax=Tumebacillus sp. BK434 TaxID=2512169 RepID=UPI00104D99A3|nr:amino acid permease [Tumebacillus sp. BK434]TCP54517.1 lysine:proton symporter (APA family) [Tumebacillus sp. BK434]
MSQKNLGFWVLTALVIGNMVGSGIFMLPHNLALEASPAAVLSAWVITGAGVLLTALVFGNLSLRKPELNGGPQMYARAMFRAGTGRSRLSGYIVAWGYWLANATGNVAIITTFASYLSTFFPVMTSQAELFQIGSYAVKAGNLITFLVCTAMLWLIHTLVLRGVEGAGKVNFVATAAKVLGFLFFIIAALFAFQKANILPLVQPRIDEGTQQAVSLFGQINGAAISTLWAFVGVESAVVFSSRARKQSDVKKATITGLVIALVIYMGITVLTMGALTQDRLTATEKPLVDALVSVVGTPGSSLMAILGLISLSGSMIGWIMLSSEVPFQAAKQGLFPRFFLKENQKGAPVNALIVSNLLSQVFIFSTISESVAGAFGFVITVATLSYLVPYMIASLYQLKLTLTGESYEGASQSRTADFLIAFFATVYSAWVIYAGTSDMKTFLLGVGMLLTGLIFYPFVKKSTSR